MKVFGDYTQEELDRQYAGYIRRLAPIATQGRAPATIGAKEP